MAAAMRLRNAVETSGVKISPWCASSRRSRMARASWVSWRVICSGESVGLSLPSGEMALLCRRTYAATRFWKSWIAFGSGVVLCARAAAQTRITIRLRSIRFAPFAGGLFHRAFDGFLHGLADGVFDHGLDA